MCGTVKPTHIHSRAFEVSLCVRSHERGCRCAASRQIDTYTARVLECVESMPAVMEVEISPEATWRPAGSTGAWQHLDQPFNATPGSNFRARQEAG